MDISVYATSDWHLGHAKIREYCPSRPVNHEEVILSNYVATVKPQDVVFFLGDMVLRWGKEGYAWWDRIKALPGHKFLTPGNHDKFSPTKLQKLGGFEGVIPTMIPYTTTAGHRLLLSHVPMVVTPFDQKYNGWRRRIREEFVKGGYDMNVHGHTHERSTGDSQCANVSVEQTEFCPALLDVYGA